MYMRYCTNTGLSRPYLAFMLASAVAEIAFSPRNGSPGSKRIMKNTSVMSTKSVITEYTSRLMTYLANVFPPSVILIFPKSLS